MQAGNQAGEPITDINITPLVDVSLVLVIIFMVTMPFLMEKAMKVKASADKVVSAGAVTEPILVEISAKSVMVEGKDVPLAALSDSIKMLIKQRQNSSVAVSADRSVSHGRIIEVLDAVAGSGATDLNILEPREKGHGRI